MASVKREPSEDGVAPCEPSGRAPVASGGLSTPADGQAPADAAAGGGGAPVTAEEPDAGPTRRRNRMSTKGIRRPSYKRRVCAPCSYVELISKAIKSSPNCMMTLREIMAYLEENNECFQGEYVGWKNSVRHNLSSSTCFVKLLRNRLKPFGKDNFWAINPNCTHCHHGVPATERAGQEDEDPGRGGRANAAAEPPELEPGHHRPCQVTGPGKVGSGPGGEQRPAAPAADWPVDGGSPPLARAGSSPHHHHQPAVPVVVPTPLHAGEPGGPCFARFHASDAATTGFCPGVTTTTAAAAGPTTVAFIGRPVPFPASQFHRVGRLNVSPTPVYSGGPSTTAAYEAHPRLSDRQPLLPVIRDMQSVPLDLSLPKKRARLSSDRDTIEPHRRGQISPTSSSSAEIRPSAVTHQSLPISRFLHAPDDRESKGASAVVPSYTPASSAAVPGGVLPVLADPWRGAPMPRTPDSGKPASPLWDAAPHALETVPRTLDDLTLCQRLYERYLNSSLKEKEALYWQNLAMRPTNTWPPVHYVQMKAHTI